MRVCTEEEFEKSSSEARKETEWHTIKLVTP